ncbi:hypothetical protein ACFP3Q_08430 [Nocardioides sp. GCM10027113]|uniref:hypothetical protein n=1 Tax=unclassified Nocardioides TaxID=2615069 RepID=UPI003617AEA6
MTVLEKLLVPAAAQRIVDGGFDVVGGPVARAGDLRGLTPAQRVAAYGLEGAPFPFGPDPDHVDVLRFESAPLMLLTTPVDGGERPWPTYPLGFLRNAAPVWELDLTRLPAGAQYVRVGRDGTERVFSEYAGAALGWRGGKGYLPPLWLVGPRARWNGLDLPASYSADLTEADLVWVGDEGVPDGFEQTRPRIHAHRVAVEDCEMFEVVVEARWRDAPVRVLQMAGDEALLLLLRDPDLDTINRLGAQAIEPSLFQALAPRHEVEVLEGIERTAARG